MIHAFGDFQLDEERYELRRAGTPIRLEPKAFRILAYLIQHRDRVVTRDELLEQFWPGEFVTASAPAHCIVKARQAVGDAGVAQRVIERSSGLPLPRTSRCCHTYSAFLRTPSRFLPCLLRYGNGACSRRVSR